jgi:hypothetical protein
VLFLSKLRFKPPNGWAHLPPFLARRLFHHSTKFGKVPPRTHAEGGQVEPVLAAVDVYFGLDT